MILAADIASLNGWAPIPQGRPQLFELSELLKIAKFHPREGRPPSFRSPDSVRYKVGNLVSAHPQYPAKGLTVIDDEKLVVAQFLADPIGLHLKALQIRTALLRDVRQEFGIS